MRPGWAVSARLAALNGGRRRRQASAEAAAAHSRSQRQMIEGMVSGLADRLASKGGSAEEWARLIRAYSVLHEPDKAKDALAFGRKALAPDPNGCEHRRARPRTRARRRQ